MKEFMMGLAVVVGIIFGYVAMALAQQAVTTVNYDGKNYYKTICVNRQIDPDLLNKQIAADIQTGQAEQQSLVDAQKAYATDQQVNAVVVQPMVKRHFKLF